MSLRKMNQERFETPGETLQEIALRRELGETAVLRGELLERLNSILESRIN